MMTIDEARKGWLEVCATMDKYAGKKLVGVERIEGTTVILTGTEEMQEVYRQTCVKAVECMTVLGIDGVLPKEGDAVYRWTKGAMSIAEQMRKCELN